MAPGSADSHPETVVRDVGNAVRAGFTALEIREAIERIRTSRTLGASKKLLQLLNFVVETALRGEGDQLKETVIAVSVFGRPTDYDPKADTVVRNQALRLRLKLSDYYESEGAREPLMIQIPKGQYAPRFVARASPSKPLTVAPHRRSHI